ncbi:cytochrome P450, partial [Streptomyces klenkii]
AMLSPSGPGGAGEAAAGREPADAEPTDAELTDMVMAVFLAGTETTASALTWALYLLATHRDVEERLHAEVDRVLAGGPVAFAHLPELQVTGHVVTETLRLHPPGWMLTRVTTADTELAGARLPAGTPLACSPHLLHHRPDLHEEPRRFTPERWARERPDRATYIPFGAGARKCVGDRFAVTEAVLALASIASRWRLSPLTDRPPPHSLRHVPSPRGLRMRATARP